MAARSLNKVILIGNLTRDPELRYTPQGTPVCSFGIATNREWVDNNGQKQEDAEFHNVVAWNKLGEICSNLLYKGRKVYVEGRLSTRTWTGQDSVERRTTEVVIDEMIAFGPGKPGQGEDSSESSSGMVDTSDLTSENPSVDQGVSLEVEDKKEEKRSVEKNLAEEVADDIPF